MAASQLKEAFLHLSQHSVDSVQNGKGFTDWDEYIHVDRPIESKPMEKVSLYDITPNRVAYQVLRRKRE